MIRILTIGLVHSAKVEKREDAKPGLMRNSNQDRYTITRALIMLKDEDPRGRRTTMSSSM